MVHFPERHVWSPENKPRRSTRVCVLRGTAEGNFCCWTMNKSCQSTWTQLWYSTPQVVPMCDLPNRSLNTILGYIGSVWTGWETPILMWLQRLPHIKIASLATIRRHTFFHGPTHTHRYIYIYKYKPHPCSIVLPASKHYDASYPCLGCGSIRGCGSHIPTSGSFFLLSCTSLYIINDPNCSPVNMNTTLW